MRKIAVMTGKSGVAINHDGGIVAMSAFSERAQRIIWEFERVGMLHCEWTDAEHLMSDPTIDDGIKCDILEAIA